jgi:hypothetical protein
LLHLESEQLLLKSIDSAHHLTLVVALGNAHGRVASHSRVHHAHSGERHLTESLEHGLLGNVGIHSFKEGFFSARVARSLTILHSGICSGNLGLTPLLQSQVSRVEGVVKPLVSLRSGSFREGL